MQYIMRPKGVDHEQRFQIENGSLAVEDLHTGHQLRIELKQVRRIDLVSRAHDAHCRVRTADGTEIRIPALHTLSNSEHEIKSAEYACFIDGLHRHLMDANPGVLYRGRNLRHGRLGFIAAMSGLLPSAMVHP